jgi:hypothetical protein
MKTTTSSIKFWAISWEKIPEKPSHFFQFLELNDVKRCPNVFIVYLQKKNKISIQRQVNTSNKPLTYHQ